jgi:transcription termination factor NusB
MLEELIGEGLPTWVALWVPAGANLPSDEPDVSEFAALVREAAIKLDPVERSYVSLPAKLYLRKNADTGGVVSVTGGLNPHWARFTERVRGSYDLDSTQLHRLPESEEHLEKLLDGVVEKTETLDAGQYAVIETIDAWTVQRLSGEPGVTIVGAPPAVAGEGGIAVRRNFRRILAGAEPLREAKVGAPALVVLGYYARIEQEGATVAMRGFEPALYSGIDFVCLVADGVVKPLIQPPDGLLPWARAGQA